MRISDWSSDVCSSDLVGGGDVGRPSGVNRSTQCSAHAMSARAIAIDLLAKLLDSGNKHAAGARARAPALTAPQFKSYSELRSWQHKQECDEIGRASCRERVGQYV